MWSGVVWREKQGEGGTKGGTNEVGGAVERCNKVSKVSVRSQA